MSASRAQPLVWPVASAPALSREEFAIARSVLYAALFDYPLTLTQLRQTLIGCALEPAAIVDVYERSAVLQSIVGCRDGWYFPAGRAELCDERRRRESRSLEFLRRHDRFLSIVAAMPYIRMVALSGSVAHLNLDGDGDLDLFIVVRGRRVWSVTVAVIVLAKWLGVRKTVCANFVIADSRMALDECDLFTASQIIHLKPIIGADVFARFVRANPCVGQFYPNFSPSAEPVRARRARVLAVARRVTEVVALPLSAVAEWACRRAYGWYLRRRSGSWLSPAQVRLEADCLKLHTRSHRRSILERFDRAINDLPIDSP